MCSCVRRIWTLCWPTSAADPQLGLLLVTSARPKVALVTLGCARNDVDSEELAAALTGDGWDLVDEADNADAVVVNTCGFITAAKQDSIDALLAASDLKSAGTVKAVIAVGCFAERYGEELAEQLPEADAVLGFDAYPDLGDRLRRVLDGQKLGSHTPRDRRTLLPIPPFERGQAAVDNAVVIPGHATAATIDGAIDGSVGHGGLTQVLRKRLSDAPTAPLKIASGCDRRCSFCAIPSFRGSYISRPTADVLAEAQWLAAQGVREVVLVSENTTSYGKDLGEPRLLERLLPSLASIDGITWVRASYLQPAETRHELIDVIAGTPGVVPYFDMSFQHSSPTVLRRMRRFGGTEHFLDLITHMRMRDPECGVRSNVIVGFPGETDDDIAELESFLTQARLDAIGVFGYSAEEGTEAAGFDDELPESEIRARVEHITALVDELVNQRAEDRVGQSSQMLIEHVRDGVYEGRLAHQAPEIDGNATLAAAAGDFRVGDFVDVTVAAANGADLVVEVRS